MVLKRKIDLYVFHPADNSRSPRPGQQVRLRPTPGGHLGIPQGHTECDQRLPRLQRVQLLPAQGPLLRLQYVRRLSRARSHEIRRFPLPLRVRSVRTVREGLVLCARNRDLSRNHALGVAQRGRGRGGEGTAECCAAAADSHGAPARRDQELSTLRPKQYSGRHRHEHF